MATLSGWFIRALIPALVSLWGLLSSAGLAGAADNAVLNFPPDTDVGRVLTLDPGWKATGSGASGKAYARARGVVKVVPGKELMLVANDEISSRVHVLRGLPPDALSCLVMNNLAIGDREMRAVKHLTGLRRLELNDTDIGDGAIASLAALKNLEYLSMSRTLIKGTTLNLLGPLPRLQRLQLDSDALAGDACRALATLPQLRWLNVTRCGITDGDLEELSKAPRLESLILFNNNAVTDSGVRQLAALKTLRRLELGGTKVTPSAILALAGLRIKAVKFNSSCKNDRSLPQLTRLFPKIDIKFEDDNYRIPSEMFAPLH